MRDFFRKELDRMHLTTGLQQRYKLTDKEITELLDLLVWKCSQFPLIPDEEKQKFIREAMLTDTEFLGFNAKILHKWLNVLNRGYIVTQAQFQESQKVTYPDYLKMCERDGIEPLKEEDYDKPVKTETLDKFLNQTKADMAGQTMQEQAAFNRAIWLEEQRNKFGVSAEKRAEIQEERDRRAWEKDCFNDDATRKDTWVPFDRWKEIRDVRQQAKLMQGTSVLTEQDLTPQPSESQKEN